jgi:hypothetical protein
MGQEDVTFGIRTNQIGTLAEPKQTRQGEPTVFTTQIGIYFLSPLEDVLFVFGLCHVVIIPKRAD